MKALSGFVRKCRGARSLREFAKDSGLSYAFISELEKGTYTSSGNGCKVRLDTLLKLSILTSTSLETLINMTLEDCGFNSLVKKKGLNNSVLFGAEKDFYKKYKLPVPNLIHVITDFFFLLYDKPITDNDRRKLLTVINTMFDK